MHNSFEVEPLNRNQSNPLRNNVDNFRTHNRSYRSQPISIMDKAFCEPVFWHTHNIVASDRIYRHRVMHNSTIHRKIRPSSTRFSDARLAASSNGRTGRPPYTPQTRKKPREPPSRGKRGSFRNLGWWVVAKSGLSRPYRCIIGDRRARDRSAVYENGRMTYARGNLYAATTFYLYDG